MKPIAKFEKVSLKQFERDLKYNSGSNVESLSRIKYDNIKLPYRATTGSAGYDFYLPYSVRLWYGDSIVIPTGVKCRIDDGWVLQLYPRSGHGFKYGIQLANTVGIIDSDYYDNPGNEGHIMVKLVCDSYLTPKEGISLKAGTAFCQGIFIPYGLAENGNTVNERKGGLGSTDADKI